jgi:DNA-binding NarL/FixJ family response regulator
MASSASAGPRPEAPPDAVAGDASSAAPSPLRLFLVEDSASVRERLVDFLVEPGRVEIVGFADTEADAVLQLLAHPVDVAILDLNLREGTGFGVIESLRAARPAPATLLVVLTNYAQPEFEAACRRRGADHFFDKSTQFGAVKALLRSMRRHRGRG